MTHGASSAIFRISEIETKILLVTRKCSHCFDPWSKPRPADPLTGEPAAPTTLLARLALAEARLIYNYSKLLNFLSLRA
jgi:hypothetical protein